MLGGMLLGLLLIAPLVFFYFLLLKSLDRFEPEPLWLLSLMFFWGALGATFLAILGNAVGEAGLSWAMNVGESDPLLAMSTASFVAPLVEESTKGFALLLLWGASALWLKELNGPMDGALYGGVVGLGFTLTEDVLYVGQATEKGGTEGLVLVYVVRTVMAGLGHATFTAMTGLGVGLATHTSSLAMKFIAPIGGWCAAVGLHFFHNFMVTFAVGEGEGLLIKLVAFWIFDGLFFLLLFLLAARDRAVILRELVREVGVTCHPVEMRRTTSMLMLMPFWNVLNLMGSPGGWWAARKKQLALVELAFVRHRRRIGESGSGIDQDEEALRRELWEYNQRGVFVGQR